MGGGDGDLLRVLLGGEEVQLPVLTSFPGNSTVEVSSMPSI